MRRKDREVTDFNEIVKVIDEFDFQYAFAAVAKTAVVKLTVTEMTAKVNPMSSEA